MTLDSFVQYFLMFAIVFDAAIAWFVLLKNPKRAVNQAYFFMMFWIMLWQISNYIQSYVFISSAQLYHFTASLVFIAASMIGVSAIYFTIVFPGRRHQYKWMIYLAIIGGIFAYISATNWVVLIENFEPGMGRAHSYGWFYPYFGIYMVVSLVVALAIPIYKYIKLADKKQRIQIEYLMLGLLVPIALGSLTNLIIPLFRYAHGINLVSESNLYNIGPASTVFLSALTAYAILRHRLMDIKAVIRRNVIGVIVYAITLGLFFLAGYYIVQRESTMLGLTELGGLTLILAIVLILAWPLYLGVKRLTRRLIKSQIIDIHRLSELEQRQLNQVETTEQVARLVAAHFQRVIPVTHYTCIAYNHDEFYEVVYSNLPARKFDVNEPWVQALQNHHKMIPAAATRISTIDINQLSGSTAQRASLQRLADRYQAQFIVPLAIEDFFIGVLLIGEKINDQPFSAEDLHSMESMRALATQSLLNVLRLRKLVKTDVDDYEARLENQADEGAVAEATGKDADKNVAEPSREDEEVI